MAGAAHGGAELFFERMSIALAAAGQEVLPAIRADAGRAARLRAAGLHPAEFRFGGRLDFRTTGRLRRVLQDFRPALAMAWMSRAAMHLPQGGWVTAGRLGGYYDLKYFRSCRHLVGNTRGIVAWIAAQGWPARQVHYLPNFVADFAATAAVTRASLGVPEGAPLLLGLGRLHAVKGFDVLLRAAARLPDVFVVIAGEGPERVRLEALIAELGLAGRAKLLGWREDAGPLLRAADLFVSSSRHEPLGNMVLEAFSARCPVLAANAAGPGEVIRNGVDGVLVPVEDAAALADAARRLLADEALRKSLATAGRLRFETEFSEARVVQAWLEFCGKITG
jgi:glycosyltransferase involved in cell wall biosynthesis